MNLETNLQGPNLVRGILVLTCAVDVDHLIILVVVDVHIVLIPASATKTTFLLGLLALASFSPLSHFVSENTLDAPFSLTIEHDRRLEYKTIDDLSNPNGCARIWNPVILSVRTPVLVSLVIPFVVPVFDNAVHKRSVGLPPVEDLSLGVFPVAVRVPLPGTALSDLLSTTIHALQAPILQKTAYP